MNELMIALAKLAEAGTEFLKAKKVESEGYLELARRRAEEDINPLVPAAAAAGPQPEKTEPEKAPEAAAGKKSRRTKEQIAADAAAAQAEVTADAQAKLAAEGAAGPAAINTALQQPAPAPQQPAAAPAAANPLGDLGAFGAQPPAPTLKEQIADAQA